MEWLDSLAVAGVSSLIADFVGFDPARFHLRLCSKETHALFAGRIKVDAREFLTVLKRGLFNVELMEPVETFHFNADVMDALFALNDAHTAMRWLKTDRNQLRKLCEDSPSLVEWFVRYAFLSSDLEFLEWLGTFTGVSFIPYMPRQSGLPDDPELVRALFDLRGESVELSEWERVIRFCLGCGLTRCLDYAIERGPIKNLWNVPQILGAICESKNLSMLEEYFGRTRFDDEEILEAFRRTLEVGWTEGALWLVDRGKHCASSDSLVWWVLHQDEEPDISIFTRLVQKVAPRLNAVMDMVIKKGFWKHVDFLEKMRIKYSSKSTKRSLILPNVLDESQMTDGVMKWIFKRIFCDIVLLRRGLSLRKMVAGLELILHKQPILAIEPVHKMWLPIGIIWCFKPPEMTERDGTSRTRNRSGDVWDRTVPNKQEETARERIIQLLQDAGADPNQLVVRDKVKLFEFRGGRFGTFFMHSRIPLPELTRTFAPMVVLRL